ncbi:unnamed protein product [Linum tenue]|uniref:Uncharacterized protein n=1 Tax=Linum tenue TaxID=586396 RepID=A0AAV0QF34_9ROSI|nr:unnamed protein product [Linum tenue]
MVGTFRDGPLLVVASGRDTISVASSIKRLASEKVFVIQIQHPRSHLNRFDLVITPRHDYYALTPEAQEQVPHFMRRWITPQEPPDEHVVLTTGALHQIDFSMLRNAASAWHEELAPLPKPLLVQHSEPNPYMGHLAWGDAFVVTADSVSMISEACTTGCLVYTNFIGMLAVFLSIPTVLSYPFHDMSLLYLWLQISESWSYPPLNDTAEAARRVVEALAQRDLTLRP